MNIPKHIGIILDGNRRFARSRNLPTLEGHKLGFENLKKIAQHAFNRGVKILTVYAFSTENWHRDKKEVSYLLDLFKLLVNEEINLLIKNGVKVNFFGRISDFDPGLQKSIKNALEKSRNGDKGILNICLSYNGRDEIIRAVKKIIESGITAGEVTEDLVNKNLDSAGLSDPDMIIRTSGEQRLSGFLTWQSIYSEFYFPKKYWPEFTTADFDLALEEHNKRQRRYGVD